MGRARVQRWPSGGAFDAGGGGGVGSGGVDLSRRVELVLSRIEGLPTLSSVAVEVLRVSSDPDVELKQVAELVGSDPSLSARVLKMCRAVGRAQSVPVQSVDRAVLVLGVDAVRAAMLSVEIYGVLDADSRVEGDEGTDGDAERFDRVGFWRFAVAVACASELIAERLGGRDAGVPAEEAFLGGLLHDLGKVVLDRVVPKSFGRSVALAAERGRDLAEVERAVIGLDHRTAGKRLAEHWGLPHAFQDVMWLHGQPAELLPDVAHARLLSVVTVARELVLAAHLGESGERLKPESVEELCAAHGFGASVLEGLEHDLMERLRSRSDALGLGKSFDEAGLVASLARANRRLSELVAASRARAERADGDRKVLEAVSAFLGSVGVDKGLTSALGRVAVSAGSFLKSDEVVILWRGRGEEPFSRMRFDREGRVLESGDGGVSPTDRGLTADESGVVEPAGLELLSWLIDQTMGRIDPKGMGVLPLPMTGGPCAVVLFAEGAGGSSRREMARGALAATWGAAVCAASQHEGARRMSERLAESNRTQSAMQRELVDTRSMARLGALTAGAAHEMNNPLTVLAGHAELLAMKLGGTADEGAALSMVHAANRLSDLVSDLHLFAEPPEPEPEMFGVRDLLECAAEGAKERFGHRYGAEASDVEGGLWAEVKVVIETGCETVYADRAQASEALTELILNALEAGPREAVCVCARRVGGGGRLSISVLDDGVGISEHAMQHAFDPFFSEKPAGRQTGMGLARASRLASLNGGEVELRRRRRGTEAVLVLRSCPEGAEGGRVVAEDGGLRAA